MAAGPTIVAKFVADTSKMTSDVDSATSKMGSSIGSAAKGAALALGGAFAVGEIVQFGKASVEAAAADAEAQSKLANTLKNVTGATDSQIASAEAFISNLSKQTAIADDDLRPAMDNLVRGFGDAESAQKALALATDISAGTGKDLGSVSEALMKAANGQTGALRKLGIETTNADGSAKSLDEIMNDLGSTFQGQAAAGAESTAGQMRAAQIAMGEMQETIGTALLPVIAKLATFLTGTLLPAMETGFGWIMDNKGVVIAAVIGVGAVLLPLFISWAASAAVAAAATIAAAAPFILIAAVIAGVAYLIISNWDSIVAAAKACWDAVYGAIQFVWHWIRDNWPLLLAILTGPFGIAVKLIVDNWDTIMAAGKAVWDWIKSTWNTVSGYITAPIQAAASFVSARWDDIKNAALTVWNWITGTWQSISGYITAPIQSAKDIIVGLWEGIKSAATGAYNWVKDKFDDMANAIENVIGGIRTAVTNIVNAIKNPINAVIRAWNGLSFQIPSFTLPKVHVPGTDIDFGGGTYGGQSINFPNLPTLAAGGVLTSPTLFIGGEAGTEIVAPESLLRAIVGEESRGHYTLNIYPRTADASDVAYGFRRLELMAGMT